MLRRLRSQWLASFTLTAFLFAQPVVGCAALCLLEHHHALHGTAGIDGGAVSGQVACHLGLDDAGRHGTAQTLSPMEPAGQSPVVRVAAMRAGVSEAPLTATPQVFPKVDPPPPRLA
jgi:hypothetical protein